MRLSPAGDALRPHARRALEEVSAGAVAAVRASQGEIGHLTVGFIETAASTFVPRAVRRFRCVRPEVGLTLRELSVDAQIEGLRSGALDVGIVRPPIDSEELELRTVVEEGLLAVVPAGHRLASRKRISAGALVEEPLVALSREAVPGLHDQVITVLGEQGGTARITQEATSIQAVLGLVAAGLGIALLPSSVRMLGRDGVAFVTLAPSPRSTMLTACRKDDPSPLLAAFLAATRGEDMGT